MGVDGVSLADALIGRDIPEHPVYSEFIDRTDGKPFFVPYEDTDEFCHSFMLREGDYKYITYQGFEKDDALFNIKQDPQERTNLAASEPRVLTLMKDNSRDLLMHEKAAKNFRIEARVDDLLTKWEKAKGYSYEDMRWKGISEKAGQEPEICVRNPYFEK